MKAPAKAGVALILATWLRFSSGQALAAGKHSRQNDRRTDGVPIDSPWNGPWGLAPAPWGVLSTAERAGRGSQEFLPSPWAANLGANVINGTGGDLIPGADNWKGGTGNWTTVADWTAGVPVSTSQVTIDSGGTDLVTLNTSHHCLAGARRHHREFDTPE